MYKVASIFSGCGGADLGILGDFVFNGKHYDKLPFELVFVNDIDQRALDTHTLNFSKCEIVNNDICEIKSFDIPEHDIIVGGFPCQSFSTVNPSKNPFDERANLYKQMVRIVFEKQPKIFIAENVKGLMTLHKGQIFRRVIHDFEESGYKVYHSLVNAADYGVPQKRQRVIIVGVRKDITKEFIFPVKTHESSWVPLSVCIPVLDIAEDKYYFSERAVQGMKNAKTNMKRGLAQKLDEPSLTVTSHLAKVSLNSRDPVLLVNPDKDLYRRFTPREAAKIQSFPDSFKFAGSETDAYRQIGNAIPPVMFWHLAAQIWHFLDENSTNEIICGSASDLNIHET